MIHLSYTCVRIRIAAGGVVRQQCHIFSEQDRHLQRVDDDVRRNKGAFPAADRVSSRHDRSVC